MHDAIPKSLNRAPVDFRPEKFLIIWYAFGGLADDLKIADNSINSTGVSAERAEIYTSSGHHEKFETMRSRSMRLMSLSTRDCRAEIATGNFSWCP